MGFFKKILNVLRPILNGKVLLRFSNELQLKFHDADVKSEGFLLLCCYFPKFSRQKKVCTAVFSAASQAFDKVSHKNILTKLSTQLSRSYCTLLKSYLKNSLFRVKYEDFPN